jgi:peptidoglycan hydrolase-like protein with peptidoglycan-binding domain
VRFSETLRPGDRGESVMALQRCLNSQGAQLVVDGSYGPQTQAAVRDFQREAGIVADGVFGPATREQLGSVA